MKLHAGEQLGFEVPPGEELALKQEVVDQYLDHDEHRVQAAASEEQEHRATAVVEVVR